MKLEDQSRLFCDVCLQAPPNPDRDDNLCTVCGVLSDKYNTFLEENLNLEDDNEFNK